MQHRGITAPSAKGGITSPGFAPSGAKNLSRCIIEGFHFFLGLRKGSPRNLSLTLAVRTSLAAT
jgi:hypothetical protein